MNIKHLICAITLLSTTGIWAMESSATLGSPVLSKIDYTLFFSIQQGNLFLVQRSMEEGANINCLDDYNSSPLYLAALRGHPHIVEFLAKHPQIKINMYCADGSTPLHGAVQTKNQSQLLAMVTSLVEHGATVNPLDNRKKTPLDYVRHTHPEVAAYLKEHGALTSEELASLKNKSGNYY